ncbi:MAG: biotin/lipoyl-binding protein [Chthoniobacteraceae bacterium]
MPKAPEPIPAKPVSESPSAADGRKAAGKISSILIICAAVVLVFWVWSIIEHHPRTDDAVVRANVVAIVPRASGQIITLCVEDNQAVKEGDLLFEIDPDDYKLALEKANADLAALDEQIEVARAQDAELKFAVKAAEAAVESGAAQLKQADDTLHRLEPLLPKGFATAEQVDEASTAKEVATSGLAADEQRLNQAGSPLARSKP